MLGLWGAVALQPIPRSEPVLLNDHHFCAYRRNRYCIYNIYKGNFLLIVFGLSLVLPLPALQQGCSALPLS